MEISMWFTFFAQLARMNGVCIESSLMSKINKSTTKLHKDANAVAIIEESTIATCSLQKINQTESIL